MGNKKYYKVFDQDLKCRGYQYDVGKTYTHDGDISLCSSGFHYHNHIKDIWNYYSRNGANRVCYVNPIGKIIESDDKCVTDCIEILSEISPTELNIIGNIGSDCTGWSNAGDNNTGHSNAGDWNTGDCNAGHRNAGYSNAGDSNTGHRNTGHWNAGDWNTGHRNAGHRNAGYSNAGDSNAGHSNTGHRNAGDSNTGHRNAGYSNAGDWNAGDWNAGDWNTGDRNTGDRNTGDRNTGDRNTGDWNTGDCNAGDCNAGHRNAGYSNAGDWNTGDCNTGDWNTGYFNTNKPPEIRIFNKNVKSSLIDHSILNRIILVLTEWVFSEDMTDSEKKINPSHDSIGGYFKKIDYKKAWANFWESTSTQTKSDIQGLPNFDAGLFEEITGIKIK